MEGRMQIRVEIRSKIQIKRAQTGEPLVDEWRGPAVAERENVCA
jgi:hypothetical protein